MRQTCLDMVYNLAKKDDRVVFIGSDLGPGVLDQFREEMPDRFFMEGVSEANIIGMAAGMAMEGYIPYVNTIATFLTRRCLEQISMDLCLHNLPVRLIANGGGLVYAPLGPTHIAIDDIALMRSQPNMAVVSPTDLEEMKRFMPTTLDWPSPIYIRLGKGGDPVVPGQPETFEIGKAALVKPAGDVLIAASGVMVNRALEAADILDGKSVNCGVANFHTIKPLDEPFLLNLAKQVQTIVTVDEHLVSGGLGTAILECLNDQYDGPLPNVTRLGIKDQFTIEYGSQESMLSSFGLQPPQLAEAILAAVKGINHTDEKTLPKLSI